MTVDPQELGTKLDREIRDTANGIIETIRPLNLDLTGEHDQLVLDIGVRAGLTAALSVLRDWGWINPKGDDQ